MATSWTAEAPLSETMWKLVKLALVNPMLPMSVGAEFADSIAADDLPCPQLDDGHGVGVLNDDAPVADQA
jgi:hypothetical protein